MTKFITQLSYSVRTVFILTMVLTLAIILYQFSNNLSRLTNEHNNDNTNVKFQYFIDNDNAMSFEQIRENIHQFKHVKGSEIPFALKDQTYWLIVSIENVQENQKPYVLYVDNKLLDVFNVYRMVNETSIEKIISVPSLLNQAYPHIDIDMSTKRKQAFLVQLRTDGPPNMPIQLIQKTAFTQHVLFAQLLYGAFIGVILLMALYNFVLYFAVKDKVYLLYIGYLISAFFIMSSITGFGYFMFNIALNQLIDKYLVILHFLLVFFLLSFTLFFLRYERSKGLWYRITMLSCGILMVLAVFSLTLDQIQQATLFFAIQPAVLLLALTLLLKQINTNFSWAKYYLASWVPLIIGAAIQPAVLLNFINYSFLTSNAFLIAMILEVSFMAFALAERMKRNEQDKIENIAYHLSSGIPRKSNIEGAINTLALNKSRDFSVIIIKPEHIEKVTLYINDDMNTALFKRLYKKLSSLFNYNDAVVPLTDKNEKLCLINNTSLAFILDNTINEQPLETLVQSIQQIVFENFHLTNLQLPLGAVIGISTHPSHGNKSHQLLNRALIATKNAENSVEKWAQYADNANDTTNYLFKLSNDLKQAIEHDTLALYHQPQVDLRTLRVCSSECLLRWQHPEEGFIPPSIFVPIAEDMGLIHELTFWVIKKALTQQKYLMDTHGFNHLVSINISGKDICSKGFLAKTLAIIESCDVATDKIIFELTESASFTDNDFAMHVIEQLTELGITISIDDFGTGYSSMSQISHLPFQELKVDREFVENINQDKKRLVIAEATVKMAKGLGLEVVAEGINSEQDEETLRQFGCDIGQGYYYAKPMSLEEYEQWLLSLVNGRVKQPLDGEYIPAAK
ncbi:EAL domain-containing protein [Thalassotalea sediminis]|uniref:EAL domain-containing protein n=1 Tax=Thalassotalea sediminis TaxID=1759089 RepID=UPI002574280A|nr:EAL domain-containing protein [Thalassotalea sediminis]